MTTKTHHAIEPATKREWMGTDPQHARVSKRMPWAGCVAGALPVLMLLFSGTLKLAKPAPVVEEFARLGYPESVVLGIGILELACTVVYVIPRTSVLGGATATHVRVGDPFVAPVIVGALVRLRELIPLRS